jgi:flagellar protein FlaG
MEVRSDAIQTEVAEAWVRRQPEVKPAPRVNPVKKTEATVLRKEDDEEKKGKGREGLKELDTDAAKEIAERTQALLDDLNIRLDLEVYEDTGDMVVRIFNRESEELIREIPPEELLEIHKRIADLRGILFDEKA